MSFSLIRKFIRVLLTEAHGGYYTANNNPYSHEDYPGIDIEIYPDGVNNQYKARVSTDTHSTDEVAFNDEAEAQAWAREQAEIFRRKFLSTNPELDIIVGGKD